MTTAAGKEDTERVNTANDLFVGRRGNRIAILGLRVEMSEEEALRLAAWLVAVADLDEKRFNAILKAVKQT